MAIYERTRNGYSDIDDLNIGGAELKYKNFQGRPDKFHPDGGFRSFSVVIDDPVYAQELNEEGWHVRISAPKEEGDKPECLLQVKVSYKKYPPKIVVYTGKKKVEYTEDMISELDRARIVNADITIQPSHWDMGGNSGESGYLKAAHLTIEDDYWSSKYSTDEYEEEPF